jgi:hypothetical protein
MDMIEVEMIVTIECDERRECLKTFRVFKRNNQYVNTGNNIRTERTRSAE